VKKRLSKYITLLIFILVTYSQFNQIKASINYYSTSYPVSYPTSYPESNPIIPPTSYPISSSLSVNYIFSRGWNQINLPGSVAGVLTSTDLYKFLSSKGAKIKYVTNFTNSTFQTIAYDDNGTNYGTEFNISINKGLLIYFIDPLTTTINVLTDPLYKTTQLASGWNLVGFSALNPSDTSYILFSNLAAQNININNLSIISNGVFQTVISNDSQLYGNNYPLNYSASYFIDVTSGAGSFVSN